MFDRQWKLLLFPLICCLCACTHAISKKQPTTALYAGTTEITPSPLIQLSDFAPSILTLRPPSIMKNEYLEWNGEGRLEGATEADVPTQAADAEEPSMDQALEFCSLSQQAWQTGNLDEALSALDQAYALIIKVDTGKEPELSRQKEDLRYMISKRILEIYASRHTVAAGSHKAIPIVMNKHTRSEIESFTKGREREFFIASYKRSGRYREKIAAELKEAGLPTELSWLPLIESGFKVKALSRARALGLWQFIPSTGYKFGLKRDAYIDERMDPDKATRAAIDYLKELHRIFGDWATVLAAYNCGEGRVLRVIRSQNINYLDNFWDLYEKLPRETARYVPRFLATLHIVNNLEKYDMESIAVEQPADYRIITVNKQFHLDTAAKVSGIPAEDLVRLNPELRYKIIPEKSYSLRVPADKASVLLADLDRIPESRLVKRPYIRHHIRPGETLSSISRRYRVSVSKIARANNIGRRGRIIAGKTIRIPRNEVVIRHTASEKLSGKQVATSTYTVQRGDTLWVIARMHETTIQQIKALNNLTHNYLQVGQILKIPVKDAQMLTMGHDDESSSPSRINTYASL